ncbi:ABC transporter ATP-binding protein [Chelatococcus sp. GCM10030263]|uniref:ABC transporter ATP-binding protein n=1 Tax=Chelatococcus sp. GCM10030263 TaxID=3273387 RepID=UPI003609DC35
MPAAALEIASLTAGYGDTRVIEDLSLAVAAGRRLAVIGRNGVGKTTLLATLMGLTRRLTGSIRLDGRDIAGEGTAARARRGLGYVPQTRDIFASLTVEENLLASRKARPRHVIEDAYAMFPRLRERRHNLGAQLSGGEQQMLSAARAILGEPSVLLLDEPLEGLAPVICDELMGSFTKLAETGTMTIILVEQQLERALDFADEAIIMERGRIAWQGTPAALRADPATVDRLIGVTMR